MKLVFDPVVQLVEAAVLSTVRAGSTPATDIFGFYLVKIKGIEPLEALATMLLENIC